MVTFSNNVEPANGFLVRYLHRKAVEAKQKEKVHDPAGHQALLSVLDWVPQLWYHLHTFLEKHSTSDFLIGERGAEGRGRVGGSAKERVKNQSGDDWGNDEDDDDDDDDDDDHDKMWCCKS